MCMGPPSSASVLGEAKEDLGAGSNGVAPSIYAYCTPRSHSQVHLCNRDSFVGTR